MFAPRQRVAPTQIARVLRPDGRIGIASWTPGGAVGDFVGTVGAIFRQRRHSLSRRRSGLAERVGELFDGTGIELEYELDVVEMRFESIGHAVEEFASLQAST